MADKKDPTIKSATASDATSAPKVSDADHSAAELADSYKDAPDKPDESSIAQVQEVPEGWPGTGAPADPGK